MADSLCSQQTMTKNSTEFAKILSMGMEMFLTLCDDPDADVRLAADENLNRVIRGISDSNMSRMQVDYFCQSKQKSNLCSTFRLFFMNNLYF